MAEADAVQVVVEEFDPQAKAGTKVKSEVSASLSIGGVDHKVSQQKDKNKAQRAKLKKQLRDAFTKEEAEDMEQTEDEKKARPEKLGIAKKFMMETACTTGDGKPKKLVGTGPKDLGEYGVGVQLYFEFLSDMGWLWVFLFLFTIPMLYYTLGGAWRFSPPQTWGPAGLGRWIAFLNISERPGRCFLVRTHWCQTSRLH